MYEEGERQPYGKTLRRLAQAYGVSVGELRGKSPSGASRAGPRERSETQQARTRRRRRRVAASQDGGADAHASVEVPIEVQEGQTIRVVIELIIRPKAPVQAAGPGSAAGGGGGLGPGGGSRGEGGGEGPGPWGGGREGGGKSGTWGPEGWSEKRGAPAAGSGAPELVAGRQAPKTSLDRPEGRVKDRPPTYAEGPNGRGEPGARQPAGSPGEPRDPLDDFRRAYSQFRRRKKS